MKLVPHFAVETVVEAGKFLGADKVDEAVSDVAVVLGGRESTFMS